MNYKQAWDYLDQLQFHKIKLGLDSMEQFLACIGNPEQKLRYIHVAGTNGKGSVCTTLLTILAESGYRVGLYTSPHLSSVRERFRINSDWISRDDFARIATHIRDVLGRDKITYFEFTTALALCWFAESGVDMVVLETGLGGRLDATNVVTPLVSVITNVSMDHEAYLGNTLEAVAGEKAGIVKPGVPVVTGVGDDVSREVVIVACNKQKSPCYLYGRDFEAVFAGDGSWSYQGTVNNQKLEFSDLRCSMKGSYQVLNASLALAALQVLAEHDFKINRQEIATALAKVHWPARLETICLGAEHKVVDEDQPGNGKIVHRYLLDGAHNPAGVDSLVDTLQHECTFNRLIVVWGAMADKDLLKTLPVVAEFADAIILTRPAGERSADAEILFAQLQEPIQEKAVCVSDVGQAVKMAEKQASADDLIVVAGSLYLVGAVREILVGPLVKS